MLSTNPFSCPDFSKDARYTDKELYLSKRHTKMCVVSSSLNPNNLDSRHLITMEAEAHLECCKALVVSW